VDKQLKAYLVHHSPQVEEFVSWGNAFRFQVKSYLCQELPPLKFTTSVRSIVIHNDQVLVVSDPDGIHILPGGRVENGETFNEVIRRELLEETGWAVTTIHYLGIKHFHHLNPKPVEYHYPYPDFLQAIYVARASRFKAGAKEIGGYELAAEFHSTSDVQAMSLTRSDHVYLKAALKILDMLE
jgi:ADP-ribose pyrophosphatase YjhB (NUDIX family)